MWGGGSDGVFSIIEVFLTATLKHLKDVINLIYTIIILKDKIKVVYHSQTGKENNLVERQTFSTLLVNFI